MRLLNTVITVSLVVLAAASAFAQKARYNHVAQRALIPTELGRVYLGMPFHEFAALIDLKGAEADGRFETVAVKTDFKKAGLESLEFKFAGVSEDEKSQFLRPEKVTRQGEFGDYEQEIQRIDVRKVPKKAFIYEISVTFKTGFDVKAYALRKFGPTKEAYKEGDEYHFYDLQWSKKTADGLVVLIRYYEESRTIGLYGRIKGTEWSVE